MTTPKTTVVNVKREPCDVYIGRAMPGYPAGLFQNRHRVGPDGDLKTVLAKYRNDVVNSPELMAALDSLRGRRIGCWCKPRDCHGDILVELLGEAPALPLEPAQASLFS